MNQSQRHLIAHEKLRRLAGGEPRSILEAVRKASDKQYFAVCDQLGDVIAACLVDDLIPIKGDSASYGKDGGLIGATLSDGESIVFTTTPTQKPAADATDPAAVAQQQQASAANVGTQPTPVQKRQGWIEPHRPGGTIRPVGRVKR